MNTRLESFKNIYFLGIGGIGMSALARYFRLMGFIVKGYDKTPSPLTDTLINEGIEIHFEDLDCNVKDLVGGLTDTLVIITPAVPKMMGELVFLQEQGYTMLKRSEVLGLITQNSKGLCVAGTHGKTTTSTMLAYLLMSTDLKCNAFLGGISTNYNTNFLPSDSSEYTVIEADEFDRSFLKLSPFASIITSTDPDHLDIYGDAKTFLEGFQLYADLVEESGLVILKKGLNLTSKAKVWSYAIDEEADFSAKNVRVENGFQWMDVHFFDQVWINVKLGLPGIHNAENALACIAMCHFLGLTESEIRNGLETFSGVKRRFEFHVRKENVVYIDDYAHHPTEIAALVSSVRMLYPSKKITAIFQPHLFSRTNDFMNDFAKELSKVDELLLLPIYPARELPMPGVTSDLLKSKLTLSNSFLVSKEDVLERVKNIQEGVVVTIGAGDIDRLIGPITSIIENN
jgi:UDP-N-acetylmuramate--alanine ligase